jgi:photosystem II stability/assembly factor-like uncharacterized protein
MLKGFVSIWFFLSCFSGLYAQIWKPLGPCGSATYGNHVAPQSGTGQIHSITLDPDSSHIVYCGSPFGGLWKSYNGGKNWSNAEIDTAEAMEFSSVSDIAITKSGSVKTIWIATGHPGARGDIIRGFEPYSCGLYKSTDGGRTFTPVLSFNKKFRFSVASKKHISKVTAHPGNSNILFVASSDGLYRTVNAGKSWKLVLKETEFQGSTPYTQGVFSVEFSKANPDKTVYASGTDVYMSVKSGKKNSFKTLTHHLADLTAESSECINDLNLNIEVNQSAGGADVLYAAAFIKGDTCGSLKSKTDYGFFYYDGERWNRKASPPMWNLVDGIRLKLASVSGKPNIVYAGSGVTSVSTDYGSTWKQATDYSRPGHADIHAIEIIPETDDMLTGTDGGIFRYQLATGKVEEYNDGLCISQVIDMGTSSQDSTKILIGLQDVGANLWDGREWHKLPSGGDGYYPQHIDYFNSNHFFSCHNTLFLRNESMEGVNLKNTTICTKDCPFAFAQHPVQPNLFYYGTKDVFVSRDGGKQWCRISDFAQTGTYINPSGHIINNIEIAPSNPDVMYAGFNAFPGCCNSLLFRTVTGGDSCSGSCGNSVGNTTWEQIEIPMINTGDNQSDFLANSNHCISSIAVSDKSPDCLWISFHYTDLRNDAFTVFKTEDAGKKWIKDDEGLPPYPVTKLVYVKGTTDLLLAGTWNGVYYKRSSAVWQRLGGNFPGVYVSDIEVNYTISKVRAATFGRGVWEISLP